MTRYRPGDQPLPRPGSGPSMHDLVCDDIRARWASATIGAMRAAPSVEAVTASLQARKQVGLERYGQPLQCGNGRDSLRDLREETEDATVYCRLLIEDGDLTAGHQAELAVMYDGLIVMLFRIRQMENARARDFRGVPGAPGGRRFNFKDEPPA
jgi:hypothetical protein